jgi:hypothetical protein
MDASFAGNPSARLYAACQLLIHFLAVRTSVSTRSSGPRPENDCLMCWIDDGMRVTQAESVTRPLEKRAGQPDREQPVRGRSPWRRRREFIA